MKKSLFTLALVGGLAFAGLSQEAKPQGKANAKPQKQKQEKMNQSPEERAKKEADHAEKELGLTADQKVKWETAALTRIRANAPLRDKMKGSTTPDERKSLRTEARANVQKFDADVKSFLTDDQKTKWDAHKEKRKEKMKNQHKGKKVDADREPDIED